LRARKSNSFFFFFKQEKAMLVGVLAVWFEIYDIVKKNTIN
jgi:hypothetical protein